MVAKAELLRGRVLEIAEHRRCGHTWKQIADHLTTNGIPVSEDEIRASWPRLSRGRNPREIISEHGDHVLATALAAIITCTALRAQVTRLEAELKEAHVRASNLERDLGAIDIMALGVGMRKRR